MTIETKFSIGQPVWHCVGVYDVPVQDIIFAIKLRYNEYGQIETYYTFPTRISWDGWVKESDLFASQQELIAHKKEKEI